MSPRSAPQQWFVLVGVAVLLVLLVLLIAISLRRHQQNKGQRAERFSNEALRRGLSARERQILLAIALRSGRRRTDGIFHAVDAFHRGAVQLLAECAQTRTPQENNELKAEVSRLRQKLGFQTALAGRGKVAQGHPSSREIPVGKYLELTGRSEREAVALRAEVLRNDEIELVVALRTPLESKAGDSWLARYCSGMSAWEFRTSTVRCDGQRLILNHSEEIHFVNRRRFPRVPVCSAALIAHFPLIRRDLAAQEAADPNPTAGKTMASEAWQYAPAFVEGTVTEFAGPGLRVETRLQVQRDDRVVVMFQLAKGIDGAQATPRTLAAVGRVKHGRDIERGTGIPDAIDRVWEESPKRDLRALAAQPLSIAVELTGLSDEEIDELASLTSELSSPAQDHRDNGAPGSEETPTHVMMAV
jgi:hypothetical protein